MKTLFNSLWTSGRRCAGWLAVTLSLLGATQAEAQPTLVSTVPGYGASGVSTTNAVVFTFSEAMDTNDSTASFYDGSTAQPVSTSWSVGNTVLTCTPSPAFPASSVIVWTLVARSQGGAALSGKKTSFFMTGAAGGGSGGGSGTNQYTSFIVVTADNDEQGSTAPPVPAAVEPYIFLAEVTLSSNRTALSATVTLPSASVSNLTENPFSPETFALGVVDTNQTTFDATFGDGNYLFTVTAASSNQQVNVNLPASMTQPDAPQIANFTATQSVDPTQPFVLQWDAFAGGTAQDFVGVNIGDAYITASPGVSNALPGTTVSVTIPAGTLQPNTSYSSTVGFYRATFTTNSSYTATAIRESITQFTLITKGVSTTPLILTNASWSGHTFSFNVMAASNQNMTIQYNTNLNLAASPWKTLLTTNSNTGVIQVTDSSNTANPSVFYRALIGP